MNDKNDARVLVLNSLIKLSDNNSYSNILFNSAIKKANLDARDISFASKLFYGTIEKKITLDYIISNYSKRPLKKINQDILNILRMGLYQMLYMDKVPDSAAVNQSVKLVRIRKKESATGFVNGLLRNFIRANKQINLPDKNKDKLDYLTVKYSCPKKIIKSFIDDYGIETTINMLNKLDIPSPMWIRVNTNKTTKEQLKEELTANGIRIIESDLVENALGLFSTGSIEENKQFNEGKFHVQNLASQICCELISPKEGETVYDVCAAPGGKTFTLAELMNNKGMVHSYDVYEAKVNLIKGGAERLGLSSISAEVRDASKQGNIDKQADIVLCDVPCSGFGVLKSKPEIRYKEGIKLDNIVNLQYSILCESAKIVGINGLLFYSTCTLNKKENDHNVKKFLDEHKEFEAYELDKTKYELNAVPEPSNQLTIFIDEKLDGFFVSAFKKIGG